MKKISLILLIFLSFLLLGCQEETKLSVIVPNGIPSIAQSHLEYEQGDVYDIERVSGPQPLMAAFTSGSYDVIIAPVNLGANFHQKGSDYKLGGILTWSNLQIISPIQIDDIEDLSGHTIKAFGQGSVPEMIITYLFEEIELSEPVNIDFNASSAQESLMSFIQNGDIAIVSEPVTTQARTMTDEIFVIDLANLWRQETDLDLFPQAGVFFKQNIDPQLINQYLDDLNLGSADVNDDPQATAGYCLALDYPFEESIIASAIPNANINFEYTADVRSQIDQFLTMILNENPSLIGEAMPSETWYYQPS